VCEVALVYGHRVGVHAQRQFRDARVCAASNDSTLTGTLFTTRSPGGDNADLHPPP
jgi:hypothetical protein